VPPAPTASWRSDVLLHTLGNPKPGDRQNDGRAFEFVGASPRRSRQAAAISAQGINPAPRRAPRAVLRRCCFVCVGVPAADLPLQHDSHGPGPVPHLRQLSALPRHVHVNFGFQLAPLLYQCNCPPCSQASER